MTVPTDKPIREVIKDKLLENIHGAPTASIGERIAAFKLFVDALAVRGDERRGSLRKAPGSWQQALIRRCLNGETHRLGGILQ